MGSRIHSHADTLKYRAAVFLTGNMAGYFSFANDMMEGYYFCAGTD
jgi:hypothetical protein